MNPAEIIIIADGEATACCTEAPDLHTQIRYLAQGLSLAYGDQLTVEFLDLRQAPDHPLVRQVQRKGEDYRSLFSTGNQIRGRDSPAGVKDHAGTGGHLPSEWRKVDKIYRHG